MHAYIHTYIHIYFRKLLCWKYRCSREQRLQVGMNKLANTEQAMAALEAKLSAADAAVKKREIDADFRERSPQPNLT